MSIGLTISVKDSVTPLLKELGYALRNRAPLHNAIAKSAEHLTREYVRGIASARHRSAQRLGAKPTGFLGHAAGSVASKWDAAAATVSISSPGIGRAFKDITITPTGGRKWLTIPIHRMAYGKRVREVEAEIGKRLFRPTKKGGEKARVLGQVPFKGGAFQGLFALCASVNQRQDRTLLPSDQEFEDAAVLGTSQYVGSIMRGRAKP